MTPFESLGLCTGFKSERNKRRSIWLITLPFSFIGFWDTTFRAFSLLAPPLSKDISLPLPHNKIHTYTLTKRGKVKKYIYHCSQSSLPQFWGNSLSIQVFHRCRVHQVDCGDLITAPEAAGSDIHFSSLFAQLLGFSFGFGPSSACGLPEGVCSLPR